jgi:hypothetical protein
MTNQKHINRSFQNSLRGFAFFNPTVLYVWENQNTGKNPAVYAEALFLDVAEAKSLSDKYKYRYINHRLYKL